MIKENIGTTGRFQITCFDSKGNLKWDTGMVNNLTTNAGKAQIALLMGDATAVPFTYLAIGTSNTAPAASQTALGAEISTGGLARQSATVSRITTSVTNDTLNLTTTWTSTSFTGNVQEIGYFNASSGGTMGGRGLPVGGTKAVVPGDQVVGLYTVQVS